MAPLAAIAFAVSMTASAAAEAPTKLWEATGFEQPESVKTDPASKAIYVSNVAGTPGGRDGNGYISKLNLDGTVDNLKWVTGLDAPKGLALSGGKLYAADLDKLVEIDVATAKITKKYEATGVEILNDVAADGEGRIYVSDWTGNAIWRLDNGTFEKWVASDELKNPNGVLVEGDNLIVASWGAMAADFSTKVPGSLLSIKIADKTISKLGNGKPVGNLDGLERFDADSYLVSDWVAGKLFQISPSGDAKELLSLSQGSADLTYNAETRTAIIPLMVDGKVVAYKF